MLSFDEMKRARMKAKAGRSFARQYGGEPSDASAGAPRAAVYKGQMGHTHRKAARMQNTGRAGTGFNVPRSVLRGSRGAQDGQQGATGGWQAVSEAARGISIPKPFVIVMAVLASLALVGILVYPAARQYYVSVRELAKTQVEAQMVAERNEALRSDIEYLQTDAGIEAAAHEQLGWSKEGEHAVVVYGATDATKNKAGSVNAQVVSGAVKAPVTWYSPFLDAVFGVNI